MNRLPGKITAIENEGSISLIQVTSAHGIIKLILLESPESVFIKIGQQTEVCFKETEVILAKNSIDNSSLSNQLGAKVMAIEKGEILSRVILKIDTYNIRSVITTESLDKMNILEGDSVFALIKANEIMLSR